MSYQPYDRQPSGIVFFGSSSSDQVYESVNDFIYNTGTDTLLVPNLTASANITANNIVIGNGQTIGTTGATNAITIAGDGSVSIFGDLTVNGTTTTVNSTTLTVEDPIIVLGSGSPTIDDNKDRGVSFNYYDGIAKTGFFGYNEDVGKFTFIPDATITNEVVTGSAGIIVADLEGNASTASGLLTARDFSVTGQITANAVSFDGTNNVSLSANLDVTAITAQTTAGSANNTDYILIASGTSLRKITKANFVSDLGGMSNFIVSDGTTSETVDNGETVTFSDGTGAEFVITTDGSVPTITVNSVDSEIIHDNLSGFDANEHINHTGVILTAGDGLSGGGDISASRTFSIDISEYSATAVGAGDSFLMLDSDGSTEQRSTVDQLGTYMAGTNITNTAGVLSVPDSTIDGVIFEAGNFVDGTTIDFTVTAGTSVTAEVIDSSITEAKRSRTIETVTSNQADTYSYKDVTLIDASSNNVTLTIPSSTNAGRLMVFKRIDNSANSVIIQRNGTDSIDGSVNFQLYYKYETITIVSDGGSPTNWYII